MTCQNVFLEKGLFLLQIKASLLEYNFLSSTCQEKNFHQHPAVILAGLSRFSKFKVIYICSKLFLKKKKRLHPVKYETLNNTFIQSFIKNGTTVTYYSKLNKLIRKRRVTGGQRLTVTDRPLFTSVSVFEVVCPVGVAVTTK